MANDSELAMFTDEQIKNEIRRRGEEEERRRKEEVAAQVELAKKNINTLLEFIPKHERTSCTDGNPSNYDRDCNRCIAIRVRDWDLEAVAHVRLAVVR